MLGVHQVVCTEQPQASLAFDSLTYFRLLPSSFQDRLETLLRP